MYYLTPPSWLKLIYGKRVLWSVTGSKCVYLTFDDGPDPEITPRLLDILKENQIAATFFCVGKNVEKYPELFERILNEGHEVGNHTYSHLNGFQSLTSEYIKDVELCDKLVNSRLFRPPYGRIKPRQVKILNRKFYIVLWTLLSADFDQSLDADKCASNILDNIEEGSIIVFHDSKKAESRMFEALQKVIKGIRDKKMNFKKLNSSLFV